MKYLVASLLLSAVCCTSGYAQNQYVLSAAPPPTTIAPTLNSLVINSDGYLVATFSDGTTRTSMQKVAPTLAPVATSGLFSDLTGIPSYVLTTDNRLTLATTALQSVPAQSWASITGKPNLATVATSGSYTDLTNQPALGTSASLPASAFATAAQGGKADSALQPSAVGTTVQPYSPTLPSAWIGTTATTALAGNTVIPPAAASVTGLVKRAGSPTTDIAAVGGTDFVLPSALAAEVTRAQGVEAILLTLRQRTISFFYSSTAVATGSATLFRYYAPRPVNITGVRFANDAVVGGTSLSYTISLAKNGTAIANASISAGLTANDQAIPLSSPISMGTNDHLDIMRTTTASLGVTSYTAGGYISVSDQ